MRGTVLVTGAGGFVGRATCAALRQAGAPVRAAVRGPGPTLPAGVERFAIGDLGDPDAGARLRAACAGATAVVHLAGRVPSAADRGADAARAYRAVNVEGSARLAAAAAAAGVARFVLVSSAKVYGETSDGRPPYRPEDPLRPLGDYARSKADAEGAVRAAAGPMQLTVIRPPLVYGPGVGENFLRLLRAVGHGLPLPLGAVDNRRSLVFVDDLADLLQRCATGPAAPGTYNVSDGVDHSTPGLIRAMAVALGRPARLIPVPCRPLRWAGRLVGRAALVDSLLGSLQLDVTALSAALRWAPQFALAAGLARTVAALHPGAAAAASEGSR